MRLFRLGLALLLGACSSVPPRLEEPPAPAAKAPAPAQRGGYYKDDGPGEKPPDLDRIADATPRREPLHRFANRPYEVMGQRFVPIASLQPFRQRGVASWYGRRFHGQKTSIGETYDMYAMTAAHPTLPLPSYARVTNVANGRSVVVRLNDRGPFLHNRIIDLSYAAAHRLGYANAGSAEVEVESIMSGETAPVPAAAHYVQLGAFSARPGAEALRARVADLAAEVLMIGNLWRVQVGPYRTHEDARSVAERIEGLLNLKSLLVVR